MSGWRAWQILSETTFAVDKPPKEKNAGTRYLNEMTFPVHDPHRNLSASVHGSRANSSSAGSPVPPGWSTWPLWEAVVSIPVETARTCAEQGQVVMWRAVSLRVDYRWDPSPSAVSASHSCWCQQELDESPGQQRALRTGVQDEASLMIQSGPSMAIILPISSVLIRLYKRSHCCRASSMEQQLDRQELLSPTALLIRTHAGC